MSKSDGVWLQVPVEGVYVYRAVARRGNSLALSGDTERVEVELSLAAAPDVEIIKTARSDVDQLNAHVERTVVYLLNGASLRKCRSTMSAMGDERVLTYEPPAEILTSPIQVGRSVSRVRARQGKSWAKEVAVEVTVAGLEVIQDLAGRSWRTWLIREQERYQGARVIREQWISPELGMPIRRRESASLRLLPKRMSASVTYSLEQVPPEAEQRRATVS